MPEPVSMIATVPAVLGTIGKCSVALNTLQNSYKNSPISLNSLITSTRIISASLMQLQDMVNSNQQFYLQRLEQRPHLEYTLRTAVEGTVITYIRLLQELTRLDIMDVQTGKPKKIKNWAKMKFVWNERVLGELCQQMILLQVTLSTLLQNIQMYDHFKLTTSAE